MCSISDFTDDMRAVLRTVLMICAVTQTVLMIRAVSHTALIICAVSQTVVVILGPFRYFVTTYDRKNRFVMKFMTNIMKAFLRIDGAILGALNVQLSFGFKFLLLCLVHCESSRHRGATNVCCRNAMLHADSSIATLPLFRGWRGKVVKGYIRMP
jgi:hypothetical protein